MDETPVPESLLDTSDPLEQLEEVGVKQEGEEPVDSTGDRMDGEDGEDGDEEEDEDDEEDDVQINIGDYKPGSSLSLTPGPININMKKAATTGAAKAKVVAVDLNAEGTINGESIYDFNVDSIEEKPWTKPGADITDYFNYGFTEENWKLYCLKQRKLRIEVAEENMHPSSGPPVQKSSHYNSRVSDSIVNENSKYSGQQLKLGAGPPPGRKQCGSIDVIGTLSGGIPSRRPVDQNDFDSNPNKIQVLSRPPPLGPPPPFNMNMPPPHLMHGMDGGFIPRMPPPGMMPPNGQSMPFHPDFHSGPPPPRFMPPPNQMMGESPRGGYNDEYDDGPDDRDREYGGYMRGGSHRGSRGGGYERSGYRADDGDFRRGPPPPHSYDRREMDQREFEMREYEQMERNSSSQIRSEREERSESKEGHSETSSSRSRSHRDRDRDRDREHDSKSRDKESDREKERSESSSKRRHHDDDSKSSSSSRHKHSKRSRRDKDDDSSSKH